MTKNNHVRYGIIAIFFSTTIFLSCKDTSNIPFPENELGYTQPVTVPLVFSDPTKLKWDTAKKDGVTPIVKKFDIEALPVFPYDSTGFKPFSQEPVEVPFDFNTLPGKDFSLDHLPAQPLEFKTTALGQVPTMKAGTPTLQRGKSLSIYDFGRSHGMQAKLITTLLKSRDGALWIGSAEGLFRYDGDQIQTYIQGSSTDEPITGITEDKEGNIWFIKGDNIQMIDIHKGTLSYSNKIGFNINGLDKMITDGAGNIWVYNLIVRAVSVIDPVAKTYKNIEAKAWLSDSTGFQKGNTPRDLQIVEDDAKNIWITTMAGGVNIIDPIAGKIKYLKKTNGLGSDSLTAITIDENGQVWLGMPGGVDAIDIKKGTIKHYGGLQGFSNTFTIWLLIDNKGYLWRSTFNGIELADLKNKMIRYINQAGGLIGDVVTTAVQDNYNRTWVGTTTGLNRIDQNGETTYAFGAAQIISLKEDGSHNLWVATRNGLFIVNPQRNKMHSLDKSHGLSDNFVQAFWEKNGKMIVATDGGYNIIDPINKTLLMAGKNEGLINDTIYGAYHDDSNNMWLTGPNKGIFLLNATKKMLLHTDASLGLNDDAILDVMQDKNGMIWLATQHNGIDVINPSEGTVKYLNNQPGLKDTCSRMMLQDKYGRIWIGTDKGIYVADTKGGTLTNITTKDGLSSNSVLSLLEYNGIVLAGSKNKVSMIQAPEPGDKSNNWKISLLDNSQGLLRETTGWSTDEVTHDGKYLWGDVGLTIINKIKASTDSAQTNITGLSVMGQPQYFIGNSNDSIYSRLSKLKWDSVSGSYNLPVNLTLPYDKNYLQFQFAQTTLSRPDTVFYTYVLDGIDKNWSVPRTNSSTENYLNLPAGKYNFKVSSKGVNGKWSKPAEFKFTIAPPWYQTWWAYIIFALTALGLLRLYIVYRSRKLKLENRILEEKVEHRTNQLKESLEDLKSTQSQLIQSEKMASLGELTAGIAHEIQNPLNFVNNFSEVNIELTDELKEQLNKVNIAPSEKTIIDQIADDIRNNQEKISFHGKRAEGIVKGMLQHSRASSGQKEPTNINALADEYLRLSYHGLRAKDKSFNADFKTDFDESIGKINIIPQDIGRVLLNLFNNAFYAVNEKLSFILQDKITQPDIQYKPTVSVTTKKLENSVLITVSDNGNGIPQNIVDKIFQPFFTTKPTGSGTGLGLSLSYDIVKAHGGELKVASKENEGSNFVIQLPD